MLLVLVGEMLVASQRTIHRRLHPVVSLAPLPATGSPDSGGAADRFRPVAPNARKTFFGSDILLRRKQQGIEEFRRELRNRSPMCRPAGDAL